MAGIISTALNFEILDINNTKTIVFLDASSYMEAPVSPILQVIPPGANRYYVAQIQPSQINALDSLSLGMSDFLGTSCPMDFPDGVYQFSYKIQPYNFYCVSKYVLRTTMLERTIQNIYCSIDITCCSLDDIAAIKKDLLDVYIFLESGKANAALGYADKASKDFSLACKKVDRITTKLKI